MDDLVLHRLQFAFTIVYHYLFPQLTMGLALLIVVMKARGLGPGGERWNDAARFWIRIFGINFAVGVVTGIPMEFQFGTNWARFSPLRGQRDRADAGDGGPLRVLPRVQLPVRPRLGRAAALAVGALRRRGGAVRRQLALGLLHHRDERLHAASRRPRRRRRTARSASSTSGPSSSIRGRIAQYAHNMLAAVVTASFVVAAVGAYYTLAGRHQPSMAASSCGSGRWPGLVAERARRVPDRRSAGQDGRAAPAGGAGRDGGPLRERAARRAHPDRSAQRAPSGGSTIPIGDPGDAQLPRLRHVPRRRAGPRRFPAGRLARQHRAPLLRVPHHGGARHDPDRAHGAAGRAARLAGTARAQSAAAVGPDARVSLARTSRTPRAG